jgi:hypothetical protein
MSLIGKLGKNTLKKKITPVKFVGCMQLTFTIKRAGARTFVKKNHSWQSVENVIPLFTTTLHGPERTII